MHSTPPLLPSSLSRRRLLHGAMAGAAAYGSRLPAAWAEGSAETAAKTLPIAERAIPSTGEKLPVVGMGTYLVFDAGDDPTKQSQLGDVVRALLHGGGTLVDTSSAYGPAEVVLGNQIDRTPERKEMFLAATLEARDGKEVVLELKRSFERLQVDKVDLLQMQSVRAGDPPTEAYKAFKKQGLTRYIGAVTTDHGDYAAMEALIKRDKPDFVQVDCSIDNRLAEERLIPLAAESGAAVLIAVPFGRSDLFRRARGKPLPSFAAGLGITTWGQYFLKYLLGNPHVTTVIPGTGSVAHVEENLQAGRGVIPDEAARKAMIEYFDKLT